MTLQEQLKLLQGTEVKIGFNVSFVYCDTVTENTENELLELEKKEFKFLHDYRKKLMDHLNKFDTFWKDKVNREVKELHKKRDIALTRKSETMQKEALRKKVQLNYKKLEEELNKIKREFKEDEEKLRDNLEVEKLTDYQTTSRKIRTYTKRIETFTTWLTREVLEVYDSTYNDGTKIIKCDGLENGPYWTKEEYMRGKLQNL